MTREQAQAIVAASKRGDPIKTIELQAAVAMLARRRDSRCRLPALTPAARAQANLALVWNLWQETARGHGWLAGGDA